MFLLLALLLDPGCHSDHEVTLVEATPIIGARPVQKTAAHDNADVDTGMSAMQPGNSSVASAAVSAGNSAVETSAPSTDTGNAFESTLRTDPLEALRQLHNEFDASSQAYSCVFTRQEMLDSGMGPEQEITVKFRPEPYSVVMEFTKNPGLVKRAIYVKGKWRDESADSEELKEQAFVQPAGVAGLLVKSLKQPIRGAMAKRTGRRAIDQFGFERAMNLLVEYCEKAESNGALKLTYEGEAEFKGRRVYVIRRELPYTGPEGDYPDLIANIYIDQEHRVPIAIHTFNDRECGPTHLLGKYEYRDVNFDADVTDADFEPATYGL